MKRGLLSSWFDELPGGVCRATEQPSNRSLAPYFIACAMVVAFFAIVESARPYEFFQDDNRDFFVPLYLHNYRAALDGQLAQYNFYQSLGRPHFSAGHVAALHPIPYISIGLSLAIFDHPFAAADILVLLYLLTGAAGMVFLIRVIGLSDMAAVLAAISWTLTPFSILTSRSWTTFPPVTGTLPWIVAGALLILRGRYVSGTWIFLLSHLALFYAGAPQFVLYAGFVEGGVIVFLTALELRARTRTIASALRAGGVFAVLTILTAGLSMPLLLPMWHHAQISAFRGGALSEWAVRACSIGLTQFVNGLFVPFARFYEPASAEWCANFPASFPHQGYVVTLLLIAYPWARRVFPTERRRVLDASFITALVLLLAMTGFFTPVVAKLPVVNRFRWPFKYFGFANLLLVACAAATLDALLARIRVTRRNVAGVALVALQFVNLTVADLWFPSRSFLDHLDPVPLEEPLRERFGDGRILSISWKKGSPPITVPSIGFNYATLWELFQFGGYDPLVPARNFRLTFGLDYVSVLLSAPEHIRTDYLRFWGVRWYVLNDPDRYERVLASRGLRTVYRDARRVVMEDPRAEPLVGSAGCITRAIGRLGDDLTATVDCRRPTNVRLRFLHQSNFTATVDGKPVPIEPKVSQQMLVRVPAGVHEIRLAYDDPLLDLGLSIALLTAGAAVVITLVWRDRRRRRAVL